MVNVIEKLINKDEVKPELYHVQPSSRMSSRRHSGTSFGQNLGARPKRQQNTHQDVAPLVPPEMQSMHSFNRHFALPPLPYQSCPPVPRNIPDRSYSQEWSSLEDLITRRKKRPSSLRKCTAPLSVKSDEGNLREKEARKNLLWAVKQLEEDPNFHQINIKRLIENTNWEVMSTKREFKDPEY